MNRRSSFPSLRAALMVTAISTLFVSGCQIPAPEMEFLFDPYAYKPIEQNLTKAKLDKDIQAIDEAYAEPRTPAKVRLSLETAEVSISEVNGYEAIWRAARACAWLAANDPVDTERVRFGKKGVSIARKAIQLLRKRSEPYYYLALNLGAYCNSIHARGKIPHQRLLTDAYEKSLMAVALDPSFDHAGAHRFVGKLILGTEGTIREVAEYDEGMHHLREAARLAPEFGENHLYLGEAYLDDDEPRLARASLDRVFRTTSPKDYTSEYDRWLREAALLLGKLPSNDDRVDVSAFEGHARNAQAEPSSGAEKSSGTTTAVGVAPKEN